MKEYDLHIPLYYNSRWKNPSLRARRSGDVRAAQELGARTPLFEESWAGREVLVQWLEDGPVSIT